MCVCGRARLKVKHTAVELRNVGGHGLKYTRAVDALDDFSFSARAGQSLKAAHMQQCVVPGACTRRQPSADCTRTFTTVLTLVFLLFIKSVVIFIFILEKSISSMEFAELR
jgi:hypothetical protein